MEMSTAEAARRLGTSQPTIRSLLEGGTLAGQRIARGSRSAWRVDGMSVEKHLSEHGRYDDKSRRRQSRLSQLEAEVASIRGSLMPGDPRSIDLPAVAVERDDLRARNVNLEESLVRLRAVLEIQQNAEQERSAMVDHLLAAAAAAERVDTFRRQAISELDEALGGFSRPGHAGRLTSGKSQTS